MTSERIPNPALGEVKRSGRPLLLLELERELSDDDVAAVAISLRKLADDLEEGSDLDETAEEYVREQSNCSIEELLGSFGDGTGN